MSAIDDVPLHAAEQLQAAFFAFPNVYRVTTADTPAADAPVIDALQPTLRRHRLGYADRPVLLPYRRDGDERTLWFACVPTDSMARVLDAELQAFIGPSFAEFHPVDSGTEEIGALVRPALEQSGWRAITFRALAAKHEVRITGQWQTYWSLLERQPSVAAYVPRTFDQLRAAFDRALVAHDEVSANRALATLRERHGLSSENRLFLEIRLAAAFERWEWIAHHRLLPSVLELNLPPETYGDVVEALYETEVRPFERALSVDQLLSVFVESLRDKAILLFRTRRASRRTAVLKAFLLFELTQTNPQADACLALIDWLRPGVFGELDSQIRQRVAGLPSLSTSAAAEEALEREQFDRAYDLLWPLDDSVDVLRKLLRCARESEDPAKAACLVERLQSAAHEFATAVEAASPHLWRKVQELAAIAARPASRWAERIAWQAEGGEPAEAYVVRLRELVRSVDPQDLLEEPGFTDVAAGLLMNQVVEAPEVIESTYPLWHELFVQRAVPQAQWMPIYIALLEALRARDSFGSAELTLIRDTVLCLVHAGADATQYRCAVDEIRAVFEQVRSPHAMNWALDICDGLAVAPCRDSDARLRLLTIVIQAGIEFDSRLSPIARALLRLLAEEADISIPPVPKEHENFRDGASQEPRSVVLYSLDAEAARRAMKVLLSLHPSLHLDCNADSVCTPRLKALARAADVFVFAWKSSKHAAYDCVKAAIKEKDNLVMARGAGTTSLVAAALERT